MLPFCASAKHCFNFRAIATTHDHQSLLKYNPLDLFSKNLGA